MDGRFPRSLRDGKVMNRVSLRLKTYKYQFLVTLSTIMAILGELPSNFPRLTVFDSLICVL